MTKFSKLFNSAGIGLIALLCLGVMGIFFLPTIGAKMDNQAARASKEFCSSVVLRTPVDNALTRAERVNANYTSIDVDRQTRYQFWFGGFLGNGFTCVVMADKGVVIQKFNDEHTW